jgi:hypothetical protein
MSSFTLNRGLRHFYRLFWARTHQFAFLLVSSTIMVMGTFFIIGISELDDQSRRGGRTRPTA